MQQMRWLRYVCAAFVLLASKGLNASVMRSTPPAEGQVVLLSDFHFDPFSDPGKVAQLLATPVNRWRRLLDAPASATRAKDFEALQKTCKARGVDSSWELLRASLEAARRQEHAPLFVTVSGDMLVHKFDCRLRALVPKASAEEISRFAQKTVEFLALELGQSFPGVAIYLALGNNDSGCSDNHQTAGSEFSRRMEQSFNAGIFNRVHDQSALPEYDTEEDYSVELPYPMHKARLIVLQDVYEMPEYQDCAGKKSADNAKAQVAWLRGQLELARTEHENVWVMAHVPPGVDAYATFHSYVGKPEKLCEITKFTPMLETNGLREALTGYADVVKLAIFGHTHMDEIKVFGDGAGKAVPVKLVPSISPVNGNRPAFTVGTVRTQTAVLADYAVYAAEGADAATWAEEYRFSKAYGVSDFSGQSVAKLGARLADDKSGEGEASLTYQRWFLPGDASGSLTGMKKIWPGYACNVVEDGGEAFKRCMCPATAEKVQGQ